jgi:hypothetical protein
MCLIQDMFLPVIVMRLVVEGPLLGLRGDESSRLILRRDDGAPKVPGTYTWLRNGPPRSFPLMAPIWASKQQDVVGVRFLEAWERPS